MEEAILVIVILVIFICGYFPVSRLDKFLNENRKAIEKESEKKTPSCVMLTKELSDEEILQEIKRFRSQHKGTRIVLYDSNDAQLTQSMEHYADQKR